MNNRRILSGIVIVILLCFSGFWIIRSITRLNEQEKSSYTKKELTSMIESFKPSSDYSANLNLDKPTLVIYFNSECDHCQEEFKDLEKNMTYASAIQICLVSQQEFIHTTSFIKQYQLSKHPNIFLFQIKPDKIVSTFGNTIVPQTFAYSKNILLKSKKGKGNLKEFLGALSQ
ncbi:MAG: hypothetical protein ORN54_14705 [Cyclobacteriaceae bacterium]|nr:hypothetical protein [Cyclobacteriaceae bacterium]